jgi:hypothetical protein
MLMEAAAGFGLSILVQARTQMFAEFSNKKYTHCIYNTNAA